MRALGVLEWSTMPIHKLEEGITAPQAQKKTDKRLQHNTEFRKRPNFSRVELSVPFIDVRII